MGLPTCLTLPLIGVTGPCGYDGTSGHHINSIGVSLKNAANVTDDEMTGAGFLKQIEKNAIIKVINDLKLEISKELTFTPILNVISKPWTGKINLCKTHSGSGYFGLKIQNPCRDNYRKNKLDWIELNVDAAFDTVLYIIDGHTETQVELSFQKGLNRKNINHIFTNETGYALLKLNDGAAAYQNYGCNCDGDGLCGCNSCVEAYSVQITDSEDELCEAIVDYTDSSFYDSLDESIVNPTAEGLSYSVMGYQVSCLCSYDWMFCQYQSEMAYPVMLNMGVQIYEKSKFTERFNDWVIAAADQADYYLEKWLGGIDKFTGQKKGGEYYSQIKLLAQTMVSHIERSSTVCLPSRTFFDIESNLP
jgi:hypothetical protein